MIMLIVSGAASFLSVTVGYLGLPRTSRIHRDARASPFMLIVILTIMYIIWAALLARLLDDLMSLPIALPLVKAAGFDPLWFGIYLVVMIEVAQITPPVVSTSSSSTAHGREPVQDSEVRDAFVHHHARHDRVITVYPNLVLMLLG
jgi:TRAP-type C4-dicarboxylate transport system permease large subunit